MKVLKEYLDYIEKTKKLSKNTVASYNRDLKKYIEYLNSKEINILDVVEKEIKELEKEKDKLQNSINRRTNLLNNENYVNKAPKNLVENEKKTLEKEKKDLEIIIKKLKELN